MDRLIGLKDATLRDHFKEEGVTTTLFASAWFITMFTNTLKENAQNGVVNETLLQVWDYFLLSGWRGLQKIAVYIITSHGQILGQMPFEDILPHIPDCAQAVLVQKRSTLLYREIKKEFNGLQFSYWLKKLAAEFEESHREVKKQPMKNKPLQNSMLPSKPI